MTNLIHGAYLRTCVSLQYLYLSVCKLSKFSWVSYGVLHCLVQALMENWTDSMYEKCKTYAKDSNLVTRLMGLPERRAGWNGLSREVTTKLTPM